MEGSGTAAARTPSAIEYVPPGEAPPPLATAPPALAVELVATVPLVSAMVSVVSVAGDEAPDNAPNTTMPPAFIVTMPSLGVAAGLAKSSVPPLTVVPPV